MNAYRFPTEGIARRFARNARSRGYRVRVEAHTANVDCAQPDAQVAELVRHYAGLPVKEGKR